MGQGTERRHKRAGALAEGTGQSGAHAGMCRV